MAIVPDYRIGTASVTSGSKNVTGIGTTWKVDPINPSEAVVRPGDQFGRAGLWVPIASVTDNTHLVLDEIWPGTDLTGSEYSIRFQSDASRYTATARELIELLADGKLASLAAQLGDADLLPFLTGPNTFDLTALTAAARLLLGKADVPAMLDYLSVPSRTESAILPCGRLSLVSGVAVPTSDTMGATAIYYVPTIGHNLLPIYDGTRFVSRSIGAQLSLSLDANSANFLYQSISTNFDLFVIYDGGVPKLCSGFPWNSNGGSDTARGTGVNSTELELFNGLWVNKNSTFVKTGVGSGATVQIEARHATYVGSFRTVANGQAADTRQLRMLFNAYNPVPRSLKRNEETGTWTYGANAWRVANNNLANVVYVLSGLAGVQVSLQAQGMAFTSTATQRTVAIAIGEHPAGTIPVDSLTGWVAVGLSLVTTAVAKYNGCPGLGIRGLSWLERGAGSDMQTWFGTLDQTWNTGLIGEVML